MVSRGKLPKDMGRMLGLSAKHDYPR
jgi:hypothetical protein